MFHVAERVTKIPFLLGFLGLFTVSWSAPAFENGVLPHFKVDHTAGKLKIKASRDSADISYRNDNVDLTVRPNNKELAKVIIDSMRDSKLAARRSYERLNKNAETARSVKDKPSPSVNDDRVARSRRRRVHLDTSYVDDIGLRRNNVKTHNEEEDEQDERKATDGSDITWRGRIHHSPAEPDNNHVLSALNEIKSLMTLSMKPPNLKAFDQVLPVDTTAKYFNAANTGIKKVGNVGQSHKRRRTEASRDNQYIRKAKGTLLHSNLRNTSYNDDPIVYAYPQKTHDPYIREQHHARKECKGVRCRTVSRRPRKCLRGRCRSDLFGNKEYGEDGAFEELYLGKIKERHNHDNDAPTANFRNHDASDYDNLGDSDDRVSHHPVHKVTEVSPYHSQNDDGYRGGLYGDDDHHDDHMDGFHGGPHSSRPHNSNSPDAAFEKEFESKLGDKDYNGEGGDMHGDRGVHHNPSRDDDYVEDGRTTGEPHVGAYAHGEDENDLGLYEHSNDNLGELPSENHHVHNQYHDDGESMSHQGYHTPSNYDFDEAKEIKDEEHEDPTMMEQANGKLKDWYNANAMGTQNATNVMDEPADGEAIVAPNQNAKTDVAVQNAQNNTVSSEDKKIESKFDAAGEKPLNSSAAEQAISKLNESLASSLNESTVNAVSSYGNITNSTESKETNATKAAAFNTIKLDVANSNGTENAQANDNVEESNTTSSNDTSNDTKSSNDSDSADLDSDASNSTSNHVFNKTHDEIEVKISNLEKKVNTSGNLLKQLEDLEKKLNNTGRKNTTEALRKPLTNAEKELLRVTPEDILETHLPSSDDMEDLHDVNLARHLNSSVSEPEKNTTANATAGIKEHKASGSEKAYASIGEVGELSGEGNGNSTSSPNNETKEEGSGEDGSAQGIHPEKHAELNNEKEVKSSVTGSTGQPLRKTKAFENGAEMVKRHKTKVYEHRMRHRVSEHVGSKRHHKTKRHGRYY